VNRLFDLVDRGPGQLLPLPDGELAAICPDCGAVDLIQPIPVLSPVTEEQTMYLSCSACQAPYHVTGNFYRLFSPEETSP